MTRTFRLGFAAALLALGGCASTPDTAPESSPQPAREVRLLDAEIAAFDALGLSLKRHEGVPGVVLHYSLVPAGDYGAAFRIFDEASEAEAITGEATEAEPDAATWAFEAEWSDTAPLLLPPIGALVFLHREPVDLRLSLVLATWFASFGFDALIVDLRAYGLPEREDLIDDRGEGEAVRLVVDAAEQLGLSPAPMALIGYALGGVSAVYSAAEDPRFAALAMLAPPLDQNGLSPGAAQGGPAMRLPAGVGAMVRGRVRLRAEAQARAQINALDLVQAARQVQACTLLIQADGESEPNRRLVAELERVMPRAQLSPVAGSAPAPELALLPDYGIALADWLDQAMNVSPEEPCPTPAWVK